MPSTNVNSEIELLIIPEYAIIEHYQHDMSSIPHRRLNTDTQLPEYPLQQVQPDSCKDVFCDRGCLAGCFGLVITIAWIITYVIFAKK